MRLIHGDCFQMLPTLPDASFDLILTDPPYDISRPTNFASMPRYDTYDGYDFGEWDKGFDVTGWVPLAAPKLRPDCSVVAFTDWKKVSYLAEALEDVGLDVKRLIVFSKRNPPPHNRDRVFLNSVEVAIWAARGKWIFNRSGKYISSVFDTTNNKITGHKTEKHLPSIRAILLALSNPGGSVLDPFTGSGTVGAACKETGRDFTGIELDERWCTVARQRVEETKEMEVRV